MAADIVFWSYLTSQISGLGARKIQRIYLPSLLILCLVIAAAKELTDLSG